MKIGLFIPCFMNELYPDICKATYKLGYLYIKVPKATCDLKVA